MTATAIRTAKLMTADEFYCLPDNGTVQELIRGEVREMPLPGAKHGHRTETLTARATVYAEDNGLGECFTSETGFQIERDPDTVLGPDWAFVAAARLPEEMPDKYLPFAPDIVLETISPGDRPGRVADKIAAWLAAGVRIVWELDLKARQLRVHRPGQPTRALGPTDVLTGDDVLPGFQCPLARIFR